MAYISLYRKYRPDSFNEVQGQEPIITTLLNSIKLDKIAHAYIFSGSKGIGKTSIAKIFAKAINCLNPINGDCCNKCENCQAIATNRSTDIVELDAASNNGVEEVRKIIESVNFLPSNLKYKVYIIDEAHMLTNSAWNALLKTIEEPPMHVVFIFATTEINKIPPTILSRCQNFQFSRMTELDARKILTKVIERENISIDEESINKIIQLGNGSARDLLSILDQMCLYTNNNINSTSINDIFGLLEVDAKISFVNTLVSSDFQKITRLVDEYSNKGINFSILVNDIINICLDKLIYFQTNDCQSLSILNKSNINNLNLNNNQLISLINIWQKIYPQIKNSSDAKSIFLIGVFESCQALTYPNKIIEPQQPKIQETKPKIQINQTNTERMPIFEFETLKVDKKVNLVAEQKPEEKDQQQSQLQKPAKQTIISVEELLKPISDNSNKEIRDNATKIINKIKNSDDIPAVFNPIINSEKVVVASNNGIVLLFKNESDAFVLNQSYASSQFQQEIVKYFNHPVHVIGFTKEKINQLVKGFNKQEHKLHDVSIDSLNDLIKSDNGLLSLVNELFGK